jgi:hypothetical protein
MLPDATSSFYMCSSTVFIALAAGYVTQHENTGSFQMQDSSVHLQHELTGRSDFLHPKKWLPVAFYIRDWDTNITSHSSSRSASHKAD